MARERAAREKAEKCLAEYKERNSALQEEMEREITARQKAEKMLAAAQERIQQLECQIGEEEEYSEVPTSEDEICKETDQDGEKVTFCLFCSNPPPGIVPAENTLINNEGEKYI